MKKFSLTAIARAQLRDAENAGNGRAASTVFGGHEHTLRQTVIGIKAGTELQEHANPGEATLLVLDGRVTVSSMGNQWEGRSQDLIVLPEGRLKISATEDSSVLLTVAKIDR
ncbi:MULTISPECIES: LuxR family transcriptional regulator [unclassified Glutamicibacter]|uniref:LuxR family transcriptional regulator n=1 Tax=unclassified Glutamicibacter TaxID=2627139 RepID=UPI000FFB702E|nr:LuxR family transcriptional regulator [Glutamicibacter sp. HZAU]RWZ83027.1 LuxR family transcriptional regulator [Glutamicibacter sp. HZAU]